MHIFVGSCSLTCGCQGTVIWQTVPQPLDHRSNGWDKRFHFLVSAVFYRGHPPFPRFCARTLPLSAVFFRGHCRELCTHSFYNLDAQQMIKAVLNIFWGVLFPDMWLSGNSYLTNCAPAVGSLIQRLGQKIPFFSIRGYLPRTPPFRDFVRGHSPFPRFFSAVIAESCARTAFIT